MITAKANVVLLQLNGPKRRVEFAVLVLAVGVHSPHESEQQQHHQDDDRQDDDVELGPGDFGERGCGVVRGAAQAGQQGLGGRRAEGGDVGGGGGQRFGASGGGGG